MQNDLISRSALKKYVNDRSTHWLDEWDTAGVLLAIENAPTIDPESLRPKGKWRLNKDGSGTCSECHRTRNDVWDMDNWDNFCSHCGADMREG